MGNGLSDCFHTKPEGRKLAPDNPLESSGQSTTGGPSREDIAAAAQKRQEDARSKGVQKTGGKLTKQLERQQQNPNQPVSPPTSNLQWRTD
ncbi:hypothetical protein C1645_817218 [Glomus cerebriforme]|uniref:Uncharacterized protein n=1 Tax=Glomus cerebriforme TaxID=658196 RepID=A0A397TCB3_9GLOM|nr:hypothetical protein C1645_817218 [Glomus cerebriforme]